MNGSTKKIPTLVSNLQGGNAMSLVELLAGSQYSNIKQDPYSPIPFKKIPDLDPSLWNAVGSGGPTNGLLENKIKQEDDNAQENKGGNVEDIPKPKRPLNAYNLFFRHERARLLMEAENGKTPNLSHKETEKDKESGIQEKRPKLHREQVLYLLENSPYKHDETRKRPHRKTHGKVGFSDLARHIAQTWKSTDSETKAIFTELAEEEKQRYRREFELYKLRKTRLQKKQNSDLLGPDEIYSSSEQLLDASMPTLPLCTSSSAEDRPHKRLRTGEPNTQAQNSNNLFNVIGSVLDMIGDEQISEQQPPSLSSLCSDVDILSRTSQLCQLDTDEFSSLPSDDMLLSVEPLNSPLPCLSSMPVPTSSAGVPETSDLKDFLSELDWSRLEREV